MMSPARLSVCGMAVPPRGCGCHIQTLPLPSLPSAPARPASSCAAHSRPGSLAAAWAWAALPGLGCEIPVKLLSQCPSLSSGDCRCSLGQAAPLLSTGLTGGRQLGCLHPSAGRHSCPSQPGESTPLPAPVALTRCPCRAWLLVGVCEPRPDPASLGLLEPPPPPRSPTASGESGLSLLRPSCPPSGQHLRPAGPAPSAPGPPGSASSVFVSGSWALHGAPSPAPQPRAQAVTGALWWLSSSCWY